MEWFVSSPLEDFTRSVERGLSLAGALRVGDVALPVQGVVSLAPPDLAAGAAAFTCLCPIVAAVPCSAEEGGGARYLRPSDGAEFAGAVRRNLLRKYEALFGKPPENSAFDMEFDPDYLARRRGTRLVETRGLSVVGAMAPFRAWGSPDLLRTGHDCGFGEKNSAGFGMVELDRRRSDQRP